MAKFNKKTWYNVGEEEATDDNSTFYKKTANDLEQRIDTAINGVFFDNAGSHNAIFRGKDVTSYLEDGTLWDKISSGTFEDLYIGDYFLKDDIKYRIAGFNYYYGKGSPKLFTNHIAIVPDSSLGNGQMNIESTTVNGYKNSNMVTNVLPTVLPKIEKVFGSEHIIEFYNMLSNKINENAVNRTAGSTTGASSGWEWLPRKVDLMSEIQVFGAQIIGSSYWDAGSTNRQFPLFALAPQFINTSTVADWLRDIVGSKSFSSIDSTGVCASSGANRENSIRPFFFIGTNEE